MFRFALRRFNSVAVRYYQVCAPFTVNSLRFKYSRSILRCNIPLTSKNTCRLIHLTAKLFEDIDVKTPEFPESISEGDVKLLKKVGDAVKAEEIVCEIETEKTAIPVPSPVDGVIVEFYVTDKQVINPNTKLFKLKAEPKK